MRVKRRWMKWIFEEADTLDVAMPWERGANRTIWHRHFVSSNILKLPRRA